MSYATPNVLGGGNQTLSHSGLAAGTTTTTTITATDYRIGARMYTKAAAANGATPTLDAVTGVAFLPVAANQACVFVFGLNAAGTLLAAQGPIVANSDYTGKFEVLRHPALPDTFCPIGQEIVQVAVGGTTFTLGSSNQSGVSGVTYTFQALSHLPSQAIAA